MRSCLAATQRPSTVSFTTAAADFHVLRYWGRRTGRRVRLFPMHLSPRLTSSLPTRKLHWTWAGTLSEAAYA